MTPLTPPSATRRIAAWIPFVGSAALVALGIHLSLSQPFFGLLLVSLAALLVVPRWLARRRVRRLLVSGNVEAVLSTWEEALERVPHRETIGPLVIATALAANGMTERARHALGRAARGEVWEASLEHRLVIETLLEAFDGERTTAVGKAERLVALPLPPAGPLVRERIKLLRQAMAALARAFARRPERGDLRVLQRAADQNPLVHWPMRYAAAVTHLDRGEPERARHALRGAPAWPAASVFAYFHRELLERLARPSS